MIGEGILFYRLIGNGKIARPQAFSSAVKDTADYTTN